MTNNKFEFVDKSSKLDNEQLRPSLTYWQDAWRRLRKNKLAMFGLVGVFVIVLFGIFGPAFTPYSYEDQELDFMNMPPKLDIHDLGDDLNFYLSREYRLILLNDDNEAVRRFDLIDKDIINKLYTYDFNNNKEVDDDDVIIDFSYKLNEEKRAEAGVDFSITYKGKEYFEFTDTVRNESYPWGTDQLGRDILTRVMYGARISLTVALVATLVNLLIGVTYGSIAGYEGGNTDNIMMRIVDIINSIPLVLYVILLMVLLNDSGLYTIILALGTVYWVNMARLVRGQVLGLKEQEYVLAARTMGVKKGKIILRHLIPNAMGPIIVSMTMMIPSAVFTESFLSFIGIGVSAPQASWGTLANDALGGLTSFPYQLFFPASAIAITMLAFNFLGDGLRDALDPRLRKG
ncbi:ABC transporter permease [Mycoplasmatota bacterium]|nr:ABC transporter permease [Mycoplasmatota bacterium]